MTRLPLEGGFTTEERTSVSHLAGGLTMAALALHDATLDAGLLTRDVTQMFASGLRAGLESLALLLQTNIEQEHTAAFNAIEAMSREGWVQYAWQKLDRARGIFTDQTRPGPYLWGSPATWLAQALGAFQRVDRTLAYAQPFPTDEITVVDAGPPRVTAVFPTVIGPHGDQRQAQWELHRSSHYFLDALEDCAPLVRVPAPAPAQVVFQKGAALLGIYVETMTLLAGLRLRELPPFPGHPLPPRFIDVHKTMEWGLAARNHESIAARLFEITADGLTEWLLQLAPALDGTLPDLGALAHAIKRLGDAWRHSDDAAWNQFELHVAE